MDPRSHIHTFRLYLSPLKTSGAMYIRLPVFPVILCST